MNPFKLTSYQVESLKKLFIEMPLDVFNEFIFCLKIYLESGDFDNSIKGDCANREVKVKAQVKLLRDIATQANKLKLLINELNDSYTESIEVEIAQINFQRIVNKGKVGEIVKIIKEAHQNIPEKEQYISNIYFQQLHEIDAKFSSKYSDEKFNALLDGCEDALFDDLGEVRTVETLDVWIEESIGWAVCDEAESGSGYLESFLHAATTNWADYVKLPISYSESSLFVKYLSILLDTASTEKLSKIAYRSGWLKKNRARIDFRIKTQHSKPLSQIELIEQSNINKLYSHEDAELEQKVKDEIVAIKKN